MSCNMKAKLPHTGWEAPNSGGITPVAQANTQAQTVRSLRAEASATAWPSPIQVSFHLCTLVKTMVVKRQRKVCSG